jgi:hypothetical protein
MRKKHTAEGEDRRIVKSEGGFERLREQVKEKNAGFYPEPQDGV